MKATPGVWAGGLWVAMLVVLAVGTVGTTAAAAAAPPAAVSGLTAKQKRAKKRAVKKCQKQRKATRRRACIAKVNRKYRRLAKQKARPRPAGRTWTVDVEDDLFVPDVLTLKVHDWIDWTWRNSTVREGHNVNLGPPFPAGVIAGDFQSPGVVTGPAGRFKRQFTRPGIYNLYCNLHAGMTMTVTVKK